MKLKASCKAKVIRNDLPVLLITGCIKPCKEQPYLKLSEPRIRLEQYLSAIQYYIESTGFENIVYCDSSNVPYPLESKLLETAKDNGKNFEWICFSGDEEKVRNRGKGYGEGEIIKYALAESILLSKAEWFAKTTGRLKVKNIQKIFLKMKKGRLYFNADVNRSKGIDTRLYCCSVLFYKEHLINLYERCSDSELEMALEDLFYDYMKSNGVKFYCLPEFPVFSGVCGGNGKIYDKESKIKMFLFTILCKIRIFNSVYDVASQIYRRVKVQCGYKGYRKR